MTTGRTKLQYWLAVIGSGLLAAVETGVVELGMGGSGLMTAVLVAAWGAVQSHYDDTKLEVAKGAVPKGIVSKVIAARMMAKALKGIK